MKIGYVHVRVGGMRLCLCQLRVYCSSPKWQMCMELQWSDNDGGNRSRIETLHRATFPPKFPYELTRTWILASQMRGWRITAWTMTRSMLLVPLKLRALPRFRIHSAVTGVLWTTIFRYFTSLLHGVCTKVFTHSTHSCGIFHSLSRTRPSFHL
jgi:hypothetical protein